MDADTKLRELLAVGEHFKAQAQAGKRIDPEGVRALRLAMLAYCRLDALADTLTTAQANRLMQAGRLLRPALTALASLEGIDAEQLMAQATKGDSAAWSKWAALGMIEGEPAKADGEAQDHDHATPLVADVIDAAARLMATDPKTLSVLLHWQNNQDASLREIERATKVPKTTVKRILDRTKLTRQQMATATERAKQLRQAESKRAEFPGVRHFGD